MYESWPAPLCDGGTSEEMAYIAKGSGSSRLLILPPLFDEANKLRRLLIGLAQRLSEQHITSVIPDLGGWNESLAAQGNQTLSGWKHAAQAAAVHFNATHVLAVRTASILAPRSLPGWVYAPAAPSQTLRTMARAQSLAASEAGSPRSASDIVETAARYGGLFAGWDLGARMVRELREATDATSAAHEEIAHAQVGGSPPWLQSESSDSAKQAAAIAAIIASELAAK